MRIDQNFFSKSNVHLNRVTCQVLRSAANWSTGFLEADIYEESIHEAYVEKISQAQHYIYIENQFFISLGFPDTGETFLSYESVNFHEHFSVVKNQIAESLYKRIVRAHR